MQMFMTKTMTRVVLLLLGTAMAASAASLYTEDFDPNNNGWVGRDSVATVNNNGGVGNPAGSAQMNFALQGSPTPQTDAFYADGTASGGAFTGDYFTDVPTFTSWVFDFYADDVLPSDLLVRFGDGVNTFFRSVSSQVTSIDNWHQVTVSLSYAGWFGGTITDFNNALAAVSFVDVQVTRNGTGSQNYFLDNFQLLGGGGGGGGGSVVPEPEHGLMALGAMVLLAARRFRFSFRRA